jgi:glyoxylase-like metal-dependent hydrolase (beta-lactamase superfamily II)
MVLEEPKKPEEQPLMILSSSLGAMETNCYILGNRTTKEAVVVDPGADADMILEILESEGLNLFAVMLTHGHVDHMGALEDLRAKVGDNLRVMAAAVEQEVLMVADYNLTEWTGKKYTTHANVMFRQPKQEYEVLGERMIFFLTPGHTKGSCCYYFPKYNWLFSGDTLFQGSVGRSDLPTGDEQALSDSVNNILMKLPDETHVFPGHGGFTTIGEERRTNPFVKR